MSLGLLIHHETIKLYRNFVIIVWVNTFCRDFKDESCKIKILLRAWGDERRTAHYNLPSKHIKSNPILEILSLSIDRPFR